MNKLKELLLALFPDKKDIIDKVDDKDLLPAPADPKKPDPTPAPAPAPNKNEDPAVAEIRALLDEVKTGFAAQIKTLTDAQSAMQQTQRDKDIANVIAKAKADRRIEQSNKEKEDRYVKLLQADFENGKAVIESLPPIAKTSEQAPQQTPADKGKKGEGEENKSPLVSVTDMIRQQMADSAN